MRARTPHPRRLPTLPVIALLPALALLALGGCSSAGSKAPPPALSNVEPRLIFQPQPSALIITGTNLGGAGLLAAAPTLFVERTRDLDGAAATGPSDSGQVAVQAGPDGETISLFLPMLVEAPYGTYSLRLKRSDGQETTFPEAFVLLPAPAVTSLSTGAACVSGPAPAVGVLGTDLLVLDGVGPTLRIDNLRPSYDPFHPPFAAPLQPVASGCVAVPFGRAAVQRCTRLDAPLPAEAPADLYQVQVAQPPAAAQPVASLPLLVEVSTPVATLGGLYAAADAPLDLPLWGAPQPPGSFGLVQDLASPTTFTLDGQPVESVVAGCIPSGAPGHVQCDSVKVRIPAGATPGRRLVAWRTGSGCQGSASVRLAERPVLASVTPGFVCEHGQGGGFQVTGAGIQAPRAFLGAQEVAAFTGCPNAEDNEPCSTLTVLPFPMPAPGEYALRVENGSLPPVSTATPLMVSIAPGPASLWNPSKMDLYAGVAHELVVPGTWFNGPVRSARLVPAFSGLPVTVPAVISAAGDSATFSVPAGLAAGPWAATLQDQSPCEAFQSGWFNLHADFVLRRDTFDTAASWSVTIPGASAAPATFDPTGGNPGGASTHATTGPGPAWFFTGFVSSLAPDLGALRFDLRASGSGAPLAGAGVILTSGQFQLEHDLTAPPTTGWTSYAVAFDDLAGWTRRNPDGTTAAATAADFSAAFQALGSLLIRGRWTDGAGEAALDNVVIELRH